MAVDLIRTIEISFSAVNKTSTAINAVSRDLNKLVGSTQSLVAPFVSTAKSIAAIDAALLALAAGGIAYSISKFASFDDQMRKVSSIMGATDEEIEQLTNLTKDLGATTRYTATEAAEGLEFLAMAGLSASESMTALPQTLKLAQASATGLGDTADILTNIMAGYSISVDDLGKTSDVLTAGFTSSNTNLIELGNAFKMVGPVASSMGFELETTTAILGKLADAGYKGEMGGTALRNIMLALAAPAGNAGKLMKELGVNTEELGIDLSSSANALKSLGVDVKDAEGNLRPFPDIMDQLVAGLNKIPGPADKTAMLVEIFGKRGGPQLAALINQGSESIVNLENKIRSAGNITDRIATDMNAGIGGALDSMKSAIESTVLAFGEGFEKGLLPQVKSITDLFRTLTFSVNDGMFDDLFNAFEDFGNEIKESFDDIIENLPEALEGIDYDGFIDALFDLKDTIGSIFDGIDFDDPESLSLAIEKIIRGFESLTTFSTKLAETFISLGKFIAGVIDKFNSLDQGTIAMVGKITGIGAAVSALLMPLSLATTAFKGFAGVLSLAVANPLVAAFIGVAAATVGVVKGIDFLTQKLIDYKYKKDEAFAPPEKIDDMQNSIDGIAQSTDNIGVSADEMREKTKDDFTQMIKHVESAGSTTEWLTGEMKKLGILVVEPKIKVEGTEKAKQQFEDLIVTMEDGSKKTFKIPVDASGVDKAEKKIEEKIPAEKKMELDTQIQIEKIKAQAVTVENAFKMKASVNIAEVEANAKIMEAIANNISETFKSTGDVMTSLFSELDDDQSLSKQNAINRAISEEKERRDEILKMQKELNQEQIDYIKAKKEKLEGGEALITVNGDGLAYHLEAMMEEVFSAVQIKASQEGLDQLLLGGI